jgi:hypothetical protein
MITSTKYKQVCRLQLFGDDDLFFNNSNSVYSLPGPLLGIAFVSGGSGYTTAPTIIISGGGGRTGAVATCTLSGNSVNGITVTNYGKGYTTKPTVIFTQQHLIIIPKKGIHMCISKSNTRMYIYPLHPSNRILCFM